MKFIKNINESILWFLPGWPTKRFPLTKNWSYTLQAKWIKRGWKVTNSLGLFVARWATNTFVHPFWSLVLFLKLISSTFVGDAELRSWWRSVYFFNVVFWEFGETTACFMPTIGSVYIYIYIQKYSMLKLWLVSYIFPILGGNNCAVVAKGWVCWNSKSTRCAGSRMPGQLKWVFVKRQVPRLERIFLLKILDSETRGGESDPYSVSCFGKFERVATALEVLGYGSGFDVLV